MINTISDLLLELKNKETKLLEQYDIVKHPGIIGDMYEGLTKDILEKAIFQNLGLKVCAGKIRNSNNEFSGEIDCMLVTGEGEKIPYTDKYIYDSKNVIAVIQVKKNLFSKDIKDSYDNLRTVVNVTEFRDGERYHGILHRDAYRSICREELPFREELGSYPYGRQMIYHTLLLEAFYPARIVWGYNGFKSELALRESFYNYLSGIFSASQQRLRGFGPVKFPNLIVCDNYSLIKANGIPFAHPLMDGWWPFYMSSYENPIYFLLQIIWTRLQYMFRLSAEIFGDDDLIQNELHGFLLSRYIKTESKNGWEYLHVAATQEELSQPFDHSEWEPAFLDSAQLYAIGRLIDEDILDSKSDTQLIGIIQEQGLNIEEFISSLVDTGLIGVRNGVLELLTEKCICGILPDGRIYAGDDKTGRVSKWVARYMENRHSQ